MSESLARDYEVMPAYPLCEDMHYFEIFSMWLSCERPKGHDGEHGNGPFIEYTTMWPSA